MGPETELHRQINPVFVQKDRVTSQAFKPTPKDDLKLSVYDGDQIGPEASWKHFTDQDYASAGVLSVTVQECEELGRGVVPDPAHFPEHAVVEFEDLTTKQIEKTAKKLRSRAWERGWQFQP